MTMTERSSKSPKLDTLVVHAGREDFNELGVHASPIDLSSTYPLLDPEAGTTSLEAMAMGGAPQGSAVYGRLHNPTVRRFEEALAKLEGAEDAVAFGSGMAALTAVLLAAKERGSHVVAVRPLYGGSDHLLASGLLGTQTSFVKVDEVASALRPDTALVIIETPANPTLGLIDIEAVVRQAGSVPVLVDSTFATPVLQRPIAHGAAFSLHSATKAIGGHGDVVAGVVACSTEHAAALRRVRVATGGILHPLAGYLLHRGLQTLAIRIRAAQESARKLARRLVEHGAVERVAYPDLPGQDPQKLLGRQLHGPGSLVSFEVKGGFENARKLLAQVRLFTPAVSLGSNDSLIQHPASLTHRVVADEGRAQGGIADGLVRLSVGLEDADDLWDDLRRALDTLG